MQIVPFSALLMSLYPAYTMIIKEWPPSTIFKEISLFTFFTPTNKRFIVGNLSLWQSEKKIKLRGLVKFSEYTIKQATEILGTAQRYEDTKGEGL